jgi:hypothetical protein
MAGDKARQQAIGDLMTAEYIADAMWRLRANGASMDLQERARRPVPPELQRRTCRQVSLGLSSTSSIRADEKCRRLGVRM